MGTEKGELANNMMPQSASKVKDMHDLHFDEPPKTMYKYTSSKRAFDILMNNKIYFAQFSEFNDPFDRLVALDIDTPEGRKIFIENSKKKAHEFGRDITIENQKFVDNPSEADIFARTIMNSWQTEDTTVFCCLTDTYQSLPMWAHYAGNHTGCCLVFDFSKYSNQKSLKGNFPFHYMKRIEYQDDLPKYNMDSTWHDYSYKSREWEYEHEWRAVMFGKSRLRQLLLPHSFLNKVSNGAGLYPLGDFLHGVILGHKMKDNDKKDINVAARQRGIFVQQASPELYKYGMRLTKVDKRSNRI